MPTGFPAALDDFSNPTPPEDGQYVWQDGSIRDGLESDANIIVAADPAFQHSLQHANINDALEAIEQKLGVDGSDDEESIDGRVGQLEASNHTHVWNEVPAGAVNGTNLIFTLDAAPAPAASLMLFLNGILQRASGNDFTLDGDEITFLVAPPVNSVLVASYVV